MEAGIFLDLWAFCFVPYLLKECVQEYADFTIEEIIEHLNNEHKETGSYIAPLNNEFDDVKGRKLNMDIVFHTVVPNTDKLIPIVINLEPQAKYNPGYPIISRGIIYASRLLSVQEQGKTIEEFYNKIHKVYSIWICYNISGAEENTIRCAKFCEHVVKGNKKLFNPKDLDLAQVWVIRLGDCEAAEQGSLLRLLDVAFDKNHNITKTKKMQIFEEEYNIHDKLVAEEVEEMNDTV